MHVFRPALFFLALLISSLSFAQHFWEMMADPTVPLHAIQNKAEAYFRKEGTGQGTGYKQYKRWEYDQLLSLQSDGSLFNPVEAKHAWELAHGKKKKVASRQMGAWEELGPRTTNPTQSTWMVGIGRVKSVAVDRQNSQRIFVTSPGGGVWRSLDGGSSWTPLTDELPYLQAYSIAIDPNNSNKVFVGALGFFLYSNDAGETWHESQTAGFFTRPDRIIVHPWDQNVVYFASSAGVFRSMNGGASFERVGAINVEDIEFSPLNPGVLYASGLEVYRSDNSGNSWQRVAGFSTSGRSKVAVSPAEPESVWVLQAKPNGEFGYLYQSTDLGQNFQLVLEGDRNQGTNYFGSSLSGNSAGGQAWHNMALAVSPTDPQEIHIAGINCWRTLNGGSTWDATSYWVYPNSVGYTHADLMAMEYVGSTLYAASDGGLYQSSNRGGDWIDLSQGLGIRMFYRIGITEQDRERVAGGAQDNGASIRQGAGLVNWRDWLGSDGMETFIDYTNKNITYGAIQYALSMYRTMDGGLTRVQISAPGGLGNWVAPFFMDPESPEILYLGKQEVYKSTNRGDDWQELYDPGTGLPIRIMHMAPSDKNVIYFVNTSNSGEEQLYRTFDGGQSWSRGNNPYAREFAIDPEDPMHLVLFSWSETFESYDGGITWTSFGKELPGAEIAVCVTWANGVNHPMYVGTKTGIFFTDDVMDTWVEYGVGLPKTQVSDIEINEQTGEIFAGTYGRGLWKAPLKSVELPPVADFSLPFDQVCREGDIVLQNQSSGPIETYLWEFGEGSNPPTSSLANPPLFRFASSGVKTIRLTVTGPGGVSTSEQSIEVFENCTGNAEIVCEPSVCAGKSTTFSTPVSDSFFLFQWDFGQGADPQLATGRNVATTFLAPGTFTVTMSRSGSGVTEVSTKTLNVEVCNFNVPFKDHRIPGLIEAEDYDLGGQDVAYKDVSSGNNGGAYRQDDVDIEVSTENGYNVGWTQGAEWLEYTVQVEEDQFYVLDVRVASPYNNTQFQVTVDGVPWGGVRVVPNTGGWQNWVTLTLSDLFISQGEHVVRLDMLTNGFNVNYLEGRISDAQEPFEGIAQQIPGFVEAERFDEGGEGVAYHDNTPWNEGGQFRQEGPDLEWAVWGNLYNLGWIAQGEWVEYTVDIEQAGLYLVQAKVGSATSNGRFRLELDGASISEVLKAPFTGSWQQWQFVATEVALPAGRHVLRVFMEGDLFNLDYLKFTFGEVVTPCSNESSVGDYVYAVEDNPNQVVLDFDALGDWGMDYEIIHYSVNDGPQLNLYMNQQPYVISGVQQGDLLNFGFTYSTGGGAQRATEQHESHHLHRVGDCGSAAAFANKILHYDPFVFETEGLTIVPNPAQNYAKIQADAAIFHVVIFDPTGNEVLAAVGDGVSRIMTLTQLSSLAPGSYFVKVATQERIFIEPLILR